MKTNNPGNPGSMPGETRRLELSFHRCLAQWQKLSSWFSVYGFRDEQQEVLFFKYIKPAFIGSLDYYSRRYQTILFQPSSPVEQSDFYWQQLMKAERFLSDHAELYQYYKEGSSHHDEEYFRRVDPHSKNAYEKIYGTETSLSSAKDLLLASIITHRLYRSYLVSKLKANS